MVSDSVTAAKTEDKKRKGQIEFTKQVDSLLARAQANTKAAEEARKPTITTVDRATGQKVSRPAPTKEEFDRKVDTMQRQFAMGDYGRGGSKDVRAEAREEAATRVEAERELAQEKARASGGVSAGQRQPDGSRVTSAQGSRPEVTEAEIKQRQNEIIRQKAQEEIERQRQIERTGGPQQTPGVYTRLAQHRDIAQDLGKSPSARDAKTYDGRDRSEDSQTVVQGTTIVGEPKPGTAEYYRQQFAESSKPPKEQTFTFEKKAEIDPYAENAYEVVYDDQTGTPVAVKPRQGSGLKGTYSAPTQTPDGQYSFEYRPTQDEMDKFGYSVSISLTPQEASRLNYEAFQLATRDVQRSGGGQVTQQLVSDKVAELLTGKYSKEGFARDLSPEEVRQQINSQYAVFKANQIVGSAEKGQGSAFGLSDYDASLLVAAGNNPEDVKKIQNFGTELAKVRIDEREQQARYNEQVAGMKSRARELGYDAAFRKPTEDELKSGRYSADEDVFELKPISGQSQYYIAGTSTTHYIETGFKASGFKTLGGYEAGTKVKLSTTNAKGEVRYSLQTPPPADYAQGFRDPFAQGLGAVAGFFGGEQAGKDVERRAADFLFGFRNDANALVAPITGKDAFTYQGSLIGAVEVVEPDKKEKPRNLGARRGGYATTQQKTIRINPDDAEVLARLTQERPELLAGEAAFETAFAVGTAGIGPEAKAAYTAAKSGAKVVSGAIRGDGTIVLKITKPAKFVGKKADDLLGAQPERGRVASAVENIQTSARLLKTSGIKGIRPIVTNALDISKIELKYVPRVGSTAGKTAETPVVSQTTARIEQEIAKDVAQPKGTPRSRPSSSSDRELRNLETDRAVAMERGDIDGVIRAEDRIAEIKRQIAEDVAPYHRTPKGIERFESRVVDDPILQRKVAKTQQLVEREQSKINTLDREIDRLNSESLDVDQRIALVQEEIAAKRNLALMEATEVDQKAIDDLAAILDDLGKQKAQIESKKATLEGRKASINDKIEKIQDRRALERHDFLGAKRRVFMTEIEREKTPLRLAKEKGVTKESATGLPSDFMSGAGPSGQTDQISKAIREGFQNVFGTKSSGTKQEAKARIEKRKEKERLESLKESMEPYRPSGTFSPEGQQLLQIEKGTLEERSALKAGEIARKQRETSVKEVLYGPKSEQERQREIDYSLKLKKRQRSQPESSLPEFILYPSEGLDAIRVKPELGETPQVAPKVNRRSVAPPQEPLVILHEPAIDLPKPDTELKPKPTPPIVGPRVTTGQTPKGGTITEPKPAEGLTFKLDDMLVPKTTGKTMTPTRTIPEPKIPKIPKIPQPVILGSGGGGPGTAGQSPEGFVGIKKYSVVNPLAPRFNIIEESDPVKLLKNTDIERMFPKIADMPEFDILGEPKRRKKGAPRKRKRVDPFAIDWSAM